MVFRGRLRYPGAEQARRAASQLERLDLFMGRVTVAGPTLEMDIVVSAEAGDYPDALAALDDIADTALGGSITARLGGHPSDWVGASAPLPGLEALSHEAQELLRAVIGGDAEAVEAGIDGVLDAGLRDELLTGSTLLDTPEQHELLERLVGQPADAITSRGPASSG